MRELPRGWIWVKLGEVLADAKPGFPSGRHNSTGAGVPHLRPMNISRQGRIDLHVLKYVDGEQGARMGPGDVLFNNTNSPELVGKTAYFDRNGEWAYSNHMTRVRPSGGIDGRFLATQLHWLWMQGFYKSILSNHVNQASVSTKALVTAVDILLPPLAEQRRIVAAIERHFSRLDAGDAFLASAAHRLDATRSKVLGSAIVGIDTVPLGELLLHLRYGTSTKCAYDGAGLPVLRIPNVREGRIDSTDLKRAIDGSTDLSRWLVEAGDLLIIRTNGSRDLIGRLGVVDGAQGMAFASYLIRARPDPRKLVPEYAFLVFSAPAIRSLIESKAATSAGQYNLSASSLAALPLPVPPLPEQRRLVAAVEERLSAIDGLRRAMMQANRRTAALRRAILERAFAGELVPQDPADEPAHLLLERIRAEREAPPAHGRSRART
jgi:type I restriction enzyme S subunit